MGIYVIHGKLRASIQHILLVVIMCFTICGHCLGSSRIYAYISYQDGTIAQYRVNNGKFIPLKPATINVGGFSYICADPKGHFVYITSINKKTISAYRVNKQGGLSLIKAIKIAGNKVPVQPVIDSSGRYLYVSLGGSGQAGIAQYRININGTLSQLKPFRITAGKTINFIAANPKKPFLYADSSRERAVYLYRISENGTLVPLQPKKMILGNNIGDIGYIAFDTAGKYFYVTKASIGHIIQYSTNNDGTLSYSSYRSYGSSEWPGGGTIATDPIDGTVFITNNGFRLLNECYLADNNEFASKCDDYRITRNNELKTDDELQRVTNDKINKTKWENGTDEANAWYKALYEISANIYGVVYGPDGHYYVLNSSGVLRFFKNPDGSLKDEGAAITWDDLYKTDTKVKAINYPMDGPVFVTQKD